ncbi:ATP-binding cassette domain-containing protein [Paenibacillus sacheonensis]|uniref:ATP-binding cassette domain-containing protein n=1 Tax=Paenibacillus sacheonensis TaxID=742054 RepID=A0A7X4YQY3_9BACL|nr:ATP-binding cassette domain-containing protein [Paenibacillus sacheonensis]MBM7567189.1 ABC-2 type transport system ATP-binding protein [Paenibacillus sacheonensis]NBC70885.1 ATP-binding cassette domain-containing protein [Paenibacillus sacheonensis]
MKNTAITIRGLRKTYGQQTVLDGIDLDVPAGTIFALLGPNGAGKTTLINILSTLTKPDEGKAAVNGHDIASERDAVKMSISLTGQFAAVDGMLTARENLHMICRLSGFSSSGARARTSELLRLFDLEASAGKLVKTYSGGMRRRLDLAVSLVARRPVLFLDEPTTGLDTVSRRALWKQITELRDEGITIFLTTQYLEEADQLADRIAIIAGGRIAAEGTAQELKSRIGEERIELLGDDEELLAAYATDGSLQDIRRTLNELAGKVSPETRIRLRKPSLDDVFVALTEAKPFEGVLR